MTKSLKTGGLLISSACYYVRIIQGNRGVAQNLHHHSGAMALLEPDCVQIVLKIFNAIASTKFKILHFIMADTMPSKKEFFFFENPLFPTER